MSTFFRSSASSDDGILPLIPNLAGWRTYKGAFTNLVAFGLAALSAEWLVHQLEYLIVYGPRFGTVMATTPHRVYMAPLGAVLTLLVTALVVVVSLALTAARVRRDRLLAALPSRLRGHVPRSSLSVGFAPLLKTGLALAGLQVAIYVMQENVESVLVRPGWPGLWVVLAPVHATVLPLHLLAGMAGALVLWTLSTLLRRSRRDVQVAQVLASMIASRSREAVDLVPGNHRIPNLRLSAGILGLRSPPLPA
jgi:hypothetical protein